MTPPLRERLQDLGLALICVLVAAAFLYWKQHL
jgi:hypothetical protein